MDQIKIIRNQNNIEKSRFIRIRQKFCQNANCLRLTKVPKYLFILILGLIFSNNKNKFTYSIFEKYQKSEIDWPLPKEIVFKPLMSDKELKAFLYFMKKENIYFEFGSGGSTNIASFYKLKTYSVDSDVDWHQKLKDKNITAQYFTVDLKSKTYGFPGNDTTLEDWKKYIEAYKDEFNADIILIDGRFRVACSLDIFSKIRNDTIVLIHDYKNRKEYHIIEKFYKKIESWDTLYAFIKRGNISKIPDDIYNRYLNVQFI